MKKSLFFVAAASALMLTACSSESDVVQNTTPQTQTTVQQQAVGFDLYTPSSTNARRAGYAGVMNTDKLKTTDVGFGVMAFYQNDNAEYPVNNTTLTPNFMYNEHVTWDGGWTYSPLKYWPNETKEDSQESPAESAAKDMLSFFAYAPYVTTGAAPLGTKDATTMDIGGGTKISAYHGGETSGISAISAQDYASDPKVEWKVSQNPDNNVDLLWGVAPEGLTYTAVNGKTVNTIPGKPIVNMWKPDKDQKIKFLFEHALSRIGLSVVSAIDQVADGGNLDANTRVLIDNVVIFGDFGTQGVLNLNNGTAHKANWIEASVKRTPASTAAAPLFTISGGNGYLAPSLRYNTTTISTITGTVGTAGDGDASAFSSLNAGVLTSEQPLMVGGPDPSTKVESATPAFEWGKTLYHKSSNDYLPATVSYAFTKGLFTYDGNKKYTQLYKPTDSPIDLDASTPKLYTITPGDAVSGTLSSGVDYYKRTGSAGSYTFEKITSDGTESGTSTIKYYLASATTVELITANYSTDTYYTALLPRYFMVIPSKVDPSVEKTTVNVKITYHVVTKDTKLTDNISDVTNAITKTVAIELQNGKSYNLKLILGLTSVKLDATVKDWEVADETEVYLPKNND